MDAVAIPEQRSFGGFIDLLVFSIIAIVGAAMTLALEVMAVVFRGVANVFEYLTDACSHYALSKFTFGVIFWIMWKTFWFTEIFVLYTSILVVELLAAISGMLCSLFSLDCKIGRAAHQRTRRLCHLTRWACRRPFSSTSTSGVPENVHELHCQEEDDDDKTTEVPTATAISEGNTDTIQTATVVAIHNDFDANKGPI